MKILDVSDYNTIVDYNGIKGNYEGVVVKATQGIQFNCKSFNEKINNLSQEGIKKGAYHFLDNTGEPEAQADHFYSVFKQFNYELLPMLDIEDGSEVGTNSSIFVERFVRRFKQLSGLDMIIYSGYYYIKDNFTVEERQKYKWWVADYGLTNLPPLEGCDFILWQFTSNEQVSGIGGGVDCSLVINDGIFVQNYEIAQRHFNINLYAHIQNLGDKDAVGIDSCEIGTTGQQLRIEAISVSISDVDLKYDVHIENIGDIDGQTEGQIEGTRGQGKRLEAITIHVNSIPTGYKLQYQAHVENIGWQGWKESGQLAGTEGQSLRLEALQVRVVKA